jgi:hypothetical protein
MPGDLSARTELFRQRRCLQRPFRALLSADIVAQAISQMIALG